MTDRALGSRGFTILCIDDQPQGLAIRQSFLETFGYTVLIATGGRAGLALLESHPEVDLVLLDYRMPEMDGEQVALELRQHYPEVAIVLLTGFPSDIPESLRASIDGLVRKGDKPRVLLDMLRDLLRCRGLQVGWQPDRLPPTLSGAEQHLSQSKKQAQRVRDFLRRQRH